MMFKTAVVATQCLTRRHGAIHALFLRQQPHQLVRSFGRSSCRSTSCPSGSDLAGLGYGGQCVERRPCCDYIRHSTRPRHWLNVTPPVLIGCSRSSRRISVTWSATDIKHFGRFLMFLPRGISSLRRRASSKSAHNSAHHDARSRCSHPHSWSAGNRCCQKARLMMMMRRRRMTMMRMTMMIVSPPFG